MIACQCAAYCALFPHCYYKLAPGDASIVVLIQLVEELRHARKLKSKSGEESELHLFAHLSEFLLGLLVYCDGRCALQPHSRATIEIYKKTCKHLEAHS